MSDLQDGLLSGANPEPNKRRAPEPPKPPARPEAKPTADPLLNGKMTDETGEVAPVQMPVDHRQAIVDHNGSLDKETQDTMKQAVETAKLHLEKARQAHRKALLTEPVTESHHETSDALGKGAILAAVLGAALDPTHHAGGDALGALAQRVHEARTQRDMQAQQQAMQHAQALQGASEADANTESALANQGFSQASQMQAALNARNLEGVRHGNAMELLAKQGENAVNLQKIRGDQTAKTKEEQLKATADKTREAMGQTREKMFRDMMGKAYPEQVQMHGATGLLGVLIDRRNHIAAAQDPADQPTLDNLDAQIDQVKKFTATTPIAMQRLQLQKQKAMQANKKVDAELDKLKLQNKKLEFDLKWAPTILQQKMRESNSRIEHLGAMIKNLNLRGQALNPNDKYVGDTIKILEKSRNDFLQHVRSFDTRINQLQLHGNDETAPELKTLKQRRDAVRQSVSDLDMKLTPLKNFVSSKALKMIQPAQGEDAGDEEEQ